jgi:hypothetical protein
MLTVVAVLATPALMAKIAQTRQIAKMVFALPASVGSLLVMTKFGIAIKKFGNRTWIVVAESVTRAALNYIASIPRIASV